MSPISTIFWGGDGGGVNWLQRLYPPRTIKVFEFLKLPPLLMGAATPPPLSHLFRGLCSVDVSVGERRGMLEI